MGEILVSKSSSPFTPDQLIGLNSWISADFNVTTLPASNSVIQWGNRVVGGPTYILGGGTGYPSLYGGRGPLSNRSAIFLDNNNYFKNSVVNLNTYTVIHVARLLQDNDGAGRIFSSMNTNVLIGSWNNYYDRMFAGGWVYQGTSIPNGSNHGASLQDLLDWKITVGTVDSINSKSSFRQNGQNLISDVNIAESLNGISLGAWENLGTVYERCRCEIAEVLIYNRVLTQREIRKVEDYLNAKYGIYSQAPQTLGKISSSALPEFPSNPLAFWRLNNSNGLNTISNDTGSQSYILNVYNGYSSVSGKINSGFYFQNSSQGMWTNQQLWNFINQKTSFSVSYWVKFDNAGSTVSTQTVMGSAFGTMGFHFDYYQTSIPGVSAGLSFLMNKAIGFTGAVSDWHIATANITFQTNTWYHIVGTYDLPTITMRLYINGNLSATNGSAVIGNLYPNNNLWHGFALNGSVTLGGKEYGGIQNYDAVGFWNRTLNIKEISNLYNNGNGIENQTQTSKGKLLIRKGNNLILEDILFSQFSTIGSLQYDILNFYRTIFTTDNLDKVVRNEALQSNNRINYNLGYMPEIFTAIFDYKAAPNISGADGGYFYFFAGGSTPTTGPNGKYMGGGGSGYDPNSYRVHFDEWFANEQLAVSWNGYDAGGLGTGGTGGVLIGTVGVVTFGTPPLGFSFADNTWRTIKIQFNKGIFNIYINDTLRLTCTDSNYNIRNKTNFNFGLGGYVGGANNFHSFKNFKLYGKII